MKYWIDKAVIASQKYTGINNWISLSNIIASMFSTDTSFAATTTTPGVVKLATTEETSLGSDSIKAVTPASIAPYSVAIAAAGWTNGGTYSTKAITAATHGKGHLPKVNVYIDGGTEYRLLSSSYNITKANGNVSISILTADVPTNGLILIY